MKRRLGVVGGAGFVGVNLARAAVDRGYDVVIADVADRLGRLGRTGLARIATCEYVDLSRPGATLSSDVDLIIHLAALPHVDYSLFHPEAAVVNNVNAMAAVLAAARARDVPVLFTSSVEVYGGNDGALFREEDRLTALSPYAASKIACESLVDSYRKSFGVAATTVRLTNLFGPWQAPDRIVSRIVLQALLDEPAEAVRGRLRDFLYVDDAVAALLGLLEGGHWDRTFNLSRGSATALEDVAQAIVAFAGSGHFVAVEQPAQDGRGPSLVASPDRLSAALGWEPRVGLCEGIERTVEWYRRHRDWWEQFVPLVRTSRSHVEFLSDHVMTLESPRA